MRGSSTKPDLAVRIGALRLQNPVMAASGTFGCGEEYAALFDVSELGAIVTKTVTLKPRAGTPPPRVAETDAGMLNAIGLENAGFDAFLKEGLPFLRHVKGPKVIVSIAGEDEREFETLASRLDDTDGVHAVELNLSCPNVRHALTGGRGMTAQDPDAVRRVVGRVRKATCRTLIAKLSPNVADITAIGRAARESGADALSLINTFPAMAVDARTRRPLLGNVTGGLSGPALKPIALKMVWDVYRAVSIPIIGVGGIMTAEDAVEFMLCGASAVQVGTATFVEPGSALEVKRGIARHLAAAKVSRAKDIIGGLIA